MQNFQAAKLQCQNYTRNAWWKFRSLSNRAQITVAVVVLLFFAYLALLNNQDGEEIFFLTADRRVWTLSECLLLPSSLMSLVRGVAPVQEGIFACIARSCQRDGRGA